MHTLPVQHGDPDSAKRIEGRFRQLAKHQGVNANQLKLNLMEHYLNQWRCKLALATINVCVLDDAFRRKMRKPIPVYLSVAGLTLITSHQGIAVRLPCYVSPYEHCRIISLEKYRGCLSTALEMHQAIQGLSMCVRHQCLALVKLNP